MNTTQLQEIIAADAATLIHVLPEEVFRHQSIAGSRQACVFEIAFLDQVRELCPDPAQRIVVYGAGGDAHDARVAQEKLQHAGYTTVELYEGGLEGWAAAGLPLDSDGDFTGDAIPSGCFAVDVAQSVIRWTGRNLFNHHSGGLKLAGGEIELKNGALLAASVRIDMTTISCEDLPNETYNKMLIQHLENDDFFAVAQFPEAVFVADSVRAIDGCTDGTSNYLLEGSLTLRGVTRAMSFPVVVASADDSHITVQGVLELDRTQFGSIYGSGRFFRFLGKHIVNDHISLHIKLHAGLSA